MSGTRPRRSSPRSSHLTRLERPAMEVEGVIEQPRVADDQLVADTRSDHAALVQPHAGDADTEDLARALPARRAAARDEPGVVELDVYQRHTMPERHRGDLPQRAHLGVHAALLARHAARFATVARDRARGTVPARRHDRDRLGNRLEQQIRADATLALRA